MRLNTITESIMWLPGFGPDDDPIVSRGPTNVLVAPVIAEIIPALPAAQYGALMQEQAPACEPETEPTPKAVWPRLSADAIGPWGGKVTKFENNVAAIKLLRVLETENRNPSEEERLVLQRYTGWGGLPAAFNIDQNDTSWQARAKELKTLLTSEEWASAQASTPNAHYTELSIAEAMWSAVERFGFKGGRVLDPCTGVGHFIGTMPKEIAEKSTVTAIDLDNLSGRLTRALYGQYGAQVLIQGFEKAKLPDGYFDLVISNVPFGAYKVAEHRHKPYANWNIHNYFFAKALEMVRAGGLVAFITSTSTLDRSFGDDPQEQIRHYLNGQAEMLGAIRLPSGAFEAIADTSVTTDIIFLQKRKKRVLDDGAKWLSLENATSEMRQDSLFGKPMRINSYYVANPGMMIGKLDWVSNGYDRVPGVRYSGPDFAADLKSAIERLPEAVYSAKEKSKANGLKETVRIPAPEYVKPGAFVIDDGRIMQSEGATLIDLHDSLSSTARARISGLIGIRDAARRLLAAQVKTDDDSMLKVYQTALNASYDLFVSRHGFITSRANALAFRNDPDYPLLLSLELYDDELETAAKADIFSKRTVSMPKVPKKAETSEEGLAISLQQYGEVNPAFIAKLVSKSVLAVTEELSKKGQIFKNPETGDWETANEYLSGHVRSKLEIARQAGQEYALNVKALEEVQPEDLEPQDIEVRLGAPWLPADDIKTFIKEVLTVNANLVEFVPDTGCWKVEYNDWSARSSAECTNVFGTKRAHAMALLEQALNQQVPTIKDRMADGKDVLNPVETMAAREKQSRLKEKFRDWIWEDESRRSRLARLYNDEFNAYRARSFDGSHLTLPGFTDSIKLRAYQLDAIWRIVVSGNTLLAHDVGAGKTLTMISASMELRRLGMCSKPVHVCPNHMLEQYTAEFLRAYPTANVLMARKEDLAGDKRREFVARIATGDWDAVIMTHSTFERIKMSPGFMQSFIEEQLADLEAAYVAARQDRSNRIVKDLAKAKKTWLVRLEKLQNEFKKDDLVTFEELGIDQTFIDEAHLFKNLFRISKMARVAGLPNNNSERSFDLFVKTRYLMAKYQNRHKGVTFATGTPLSNSMGELFTMQRFLQPQTLRRHMVDNFDSWAASFGETVTALEVSPDGGGYRMNSRFAKFVNLPELMALFTQVADIRTKEMLNLPVPAIAGGKPQTAAIEASAELKLYVQGLVKRAEDIRNGMVKPHEDNMLAVTNDGRKAALDMRLINPSAIDHPDSKVNHCCAKVFDIWERSKAFRGTQLVFCDLSTPSSDGRFSVYNDLRSKWVAMGIPAEEIAFIHDFDTDAAKAKLFKAVREGKVRILMGSTPKMGMGTNVQTKLIALHHLDCPWRPSDVAQRDGRIERQGNTNAVIEIYRYVTKGSFDAYSWQTLETKARFITQVMSGKLGARSVEDVEMAALSYAEVKALASGNPLVLEKAGIDAELVKLSMLKSQWRSSQWEIKSEVDYLPKSILSLKTSIECLERDVEMVQSYKGKPFAVVVNGERLTNHEEAGKRLLNVAITALRNSQFEPIDNLVGEISGFKLGVHSHPLNEFPNFYINGDAVRFSAKAMKSGNGIIEALLATLRSIEVRLAEEEEKLARCERKFAGLLTQVGQPFEYQARLDEVLARQQEIDAALGLHKDNAGAADTEEAMPIAA